MALPASKCLVQLKDAIWRKNSNSRLIEAEKRIDFNQPVSGGPLDHGFDYYFGVDVPNFPPYCWIENNKTIGIPTERKPKEMFGVDGPMIAGWKLENILPGLAKKSAEWIHQEAKKDNPFFLYVPLTSPHSPISPSEKFKGKSGVDSYMDFMIETDWVVGHIVEAVDKAGVKDNTIIIFSTDNGTSTRFAKLNTLKKHGIILDDKLRGTKASIYEGGHRVPFIVRWPAKIKAGSSCNETICLNDFMATVADLLKVKLDDNTAEDSYSILPLLTGEKKELAEHPMVVHHDYKGRFAIRDAKWKYIPHANELYDLESDLKETKNVAKEFPEIVKKLKTTLEKYQKSGRSR